MHLKIILQIFFFFNNWNIFQGKMFRLRKIKDVPKSKFKTLHYFKLKIYFQKFSGFQNTVLLKSKIHIPHGFLSLRFIYKLKSLILFYFYLLLKIYFFHFPRSNQKHCIFTKLQNDLKFCRNSQSKSFIESIYICETSVNFFLFEYNKIHFKKYLKMFYRFKVFSFLFQLRQLQRCRTVEIFFLYETFPICKLFHCFEIFYSLFKVKYKLYTLQKKILLFHFSQLQELLNGNNYTKFYASDTTAHYSLSEKDRNIWNTFSLKGFFLFSLHVSAAGDNKV